MICSIVFIFMIRTCACIDCTNFENLYIMDIETEVEVDIVNKSLFDSTFQICEEFSIRTYPSFVSPEVVKEECNARVLCDNAIDAKNMEKFALENPHIIPCQSWEHLQCASALVFMEAHACSNPEICLTCCVKPSFDGQVFLLGTLIPVLVGTVIFISSFIYFNKSSKSHTKLKGISLPFPQKIYKITTSVQVTASSYDDAITPAAKNETIKKKSPMKSRAQIKRAAYGYR